MFSSLGKISLELQEHHLDEEVIPPLQACLFTPAVLVKLKNIVIKKLPLTLGEKNPNSYKFPCCAYDHDGKTELEQRLKQLGQGPAALGSALN